MDRIENTTPHCCSSIISRRVNLLFSNGSCIFCLPHGECPAMGLHDGNQNHHTGDLVKHTGLFYCKTAHSKMFWTDSGISQSVQFGLFTVCYLTSRDSTAQSVSHYTGLRFKCSSLTVQYEFLLNGLISTPTLTHPAQCSLQQMWKSEAKWTPILLLT
jgi:hypothetical protein